jgi:hypothetical protein
MAELARPTTEMANLAAPTTRAKSLSIAEPAAPANAFLKRGERRNSRLLQRSAHGLSSHNSVQERGILWPITSVPCARPHPAG